MKPYYEEPENGITIYHGDCREILHRLPKLGLVITSPPYNLKKTWWDSGSNGIHVKLANKFLEGWYPDELPEDEYQEKEKALLTQALERCEGAVCYNHRVRHAIKREGRVFHPMEWLLGFPLWVEIIWNRGSGVALNCRRPLVADERIYVLGRQKAWNNLKLTTVWNLLPDRKAPEHPCAFPLQIPQRLIEMFSDPGDLVLDYYMGSGTTLVAAKNLRRKAIGIEIEEKYCEIAVKRLAQEVLF